MTISFKIYDTSPNWWDTEIKKNNGLFTSTTNWASFYEKLGLGGGKYIEVIVDKKRTLLVTVYESVLGGGLILSLPGFILSTMSKLPYFTSLNMHLQPTVLDKSLLKNEEKLLKISKKTIKFITQYAKKNKKNITASAYVCFKNQDHAIELRDENANISELLGTSRLKLVSEEVNYKSLPNSVKNKINKALKSDVEIVQLKNNDISDYVEGLRIGWGANKLALNNDLYYKTFSELFPESITFFVAKYKGQVLAGSGVMSYGKTMLEFGIYMTPLARELKIPGGDLLKWELIKFGIKNKFSFLDLNMIGVTDKGELEEKIDNINYYKTKWGGTPMYGIRITSLVAPLIIVQKTKRKFLGY